MSHIPAELSYTMAHEWVRFEADGVARVGITDYAQSELGDIVFVEPPVVGGSVISVNDALHGDPGLVNRDPYGDGWFFTVRLTDFSSRADLMSAEEYLGRLGAR